MAVLIIILVFGLILVYVIWTFTRSKSTTHGIEVVTKKSAMKDLERQKLIEKQEKSTKEGVLEKEEKPITAEVPNKMRSEEEQECLQAIVKNPKDINAYIKLSVFYIQRQKWADAKEVLLEALKVDPENDKVLNNMGVVWFKLKRYNNSITAFEKSLHKNENVAHRYVNLGLSMAAIGENSKAADYFSRAISLDPEQKSYQELLSEAKSLLV